MTRVKRLKQVALLLFVVLCLGCLFAWSCSGTYTPPDLQADRWDSLTVTFWVADKSNKKPTNFTIEDAEVLQKLRELFVPKKAHGLVHTMRINKWCNMHLTNKSRQGWKIHFHWSSYVSYQDYAGKRMGFAADLDTSFYHTLMAHLTEQLGVSAYCVESFDKVDEFLPEANRFARDGDLAAIKRLIAAKPKSLKMEDAQGKLALHYSAMRGHLEVSKLLVAKGVSVDKVDKLGFTPFHIACQRGHLDSAKFFLDRGANIEGQHHMNWTPLHGAANKGHADVVNFLLARGANPRAREKKSGWTPVDAANRGSHLQIVRILEEHQKR